MRSLFLLGAVLLVAGCSTPSSLMREAPVISATSDKAPKAYALCVFPYWQDHRSTASMNETVDGYRLVIGAEANGQTDEVLDIKSAGSGSEVKLYQRVAWSQAFRKDIQASVNRCL